MKNAGKPEIESGQSSDGVFHRPSELDQDVETLLVLAGPGKFCDVLAKWVMKSPC
jgi:hypothetical protein